MMTLSTVAIKNNEEKEEPTGNQHFLLFPRCLKLFPFHGHCNSEQCSRGLTVINSL